MSLERRTMAAGGEFVEGWLVAQVLGEGAYGEVRLLVHAQSGACVALKTLRRGEGGGGGEGAEGGGGGGAREAALHRALRHPHVLRCLGERVHGDHHYLFLEYAQGGELFDRIEPDAGMSEAAARRYWRQLLAGLRYLHARGVAHRDIKPENLLLDSRDNIKISDFGMATLFRHGERERLLSRVCGTLPYAAPEVLEAPRTPYRAAPADLWSAAIVLFAMLVGELPWERASAEDPRFAAWQRGGGSGGGAGGGGAGAAGGKGAWRPRGAAGALLRRALRPEAARRPDLARLERDAWTQDSPALGAEGAKRGWCSQPAQSSEGAEEVDEAPDAQQLQALLSYSQPAHADELLLASPADASQATQTTQGSPAHGVLQRLVRRMTRVWVRCDEAQALHALTDELTRRRYRWRYLHPRMLAVECGAEVRLRVWAVRASPLAGGGEGGVVLEFRRSRGCGLQFKRRFESLRGALWPLAAPPPPHADLHAPLDPAGEAPPPDARLEPMDQT